MRGRHVVICGADESRLGTEAAEFGFEGFAFRVPPASGAAGAGDFSIAVWDATIWQRDASGDWRIAVDISTPLPPTTT